MSSTTTNWRKRQAEKELVASQKKIAKTEENFPSTLASNVRRVVDDNSPDLATQIMEAHIKDEVRKRMNAYHKAANDRERRNIVNGVYMVRRSRLHSNEDYDDEEYSPPLSTEDRFPGHGDRNYYTPPDNEGWRLVTKRCRRKHVLTNAELERLAALPGDEDWSEDGDQNGDLTDRNQRRQFY